MLVESGLNDDEIEEVVKASNILSSNVIGDLDLEVEKMFAEGTLHKFGYDCIEEYYERVTHFRGHTGRSGRQVDAGRRRIARPPS